MALGEIGILGQRMILAHASSLTNASYSIIEALPILGLTLNHHWRDIESLGLFGVSRRRKMQLFGVFRPLKSG